MRRGRPPSRHLLPLACPPPHPLSRRSPGLVVSDPSGALLSGPIHLVRLAAYACFPVFALKQVISVVQLGTAFARIAALDEAERAAKAKSK
jgi:hypothetical protein